MRKILYGFGVLCSLTLMLYGLNFFSNEIVNEKMKDNVFDRNDFAWLGFMEPWKEPYNLGTNYLKQRKYDEAIEQFDKALTHKMSDDDECDVRVNKALALTLPIKEEDVTDRNLDDVITKLETAEQVLLEKNFAAENGDGDYEIAQELYDDIVEYKLHLLDIISTRFSVCKIDSEDGEMLSGAQILITGEDKNGEEVKFDPEDIELGQGASIYEGYEGEGIIIVSGSSPTTINGIFDGKYTIHEVEAPKGYDVAKDIKFEVKHCKVLKGDSEFITEPTDFEPAYIMLSDELFRTDVEIVKIDDQMQNLPGAILTLTGVDFNGNKVEIPEDSVILGEDGYFNEASSGEGVSFVTGSTVTTVKGLVDGTYTLHEDKAPKGYAEAQDIEFTIENGIVKGDDQTVVPAVGNDLAQVVMVDSKDQSGGGGDSDSDSEGGGGQGEGGQGEGNGGEGGDQGGQNDQDQQGGGGDQQDQQGGGGEENDDQQGGGGKAPEDQGDQGDQDDKDGDSGQGGNGEDQETDNKGGNQDGDTEGSGSGKDAQNAEDQLKGQLEDLQDKANQQRSDDVADDVPYDYDYDGDRW